MSESTSNQQDLLDESILVTVRSACNVDEEDDGFDKKLIPLINSQMMMAHEFGIGYEGIRVRGTETTWRDWLGEIGMELSAIQTWLGYTVLLLFDPPDNASVLNSYQDQIQKYEWMLCNKSCLEGAVQEYVPERSQFYDNLYEKIVDEDLI